MAGLLLTMQTIYVKEVHIPTFLCGSTKYGNMASHGVYVGVWPFIEFDANLLGKYE